MPAIVDPQTAEVHALEHPVDDHQAVGMPESIRPELINRHHAKTLLLHGPAFSHGISYVAYWASP